MMTNSIEYAFVCALLAICVSSSENSLLRSHIHFNYLLLNYSMSSSLYILDTGSLSEI